jgi:hypothetical protein
MGIEIPLTNSLQAKISNKQRKYKKLAFDVRQQWQMNKTVIALVLATTGVIHSMLNQSLANINRLPRLSQAQEVVALNTCSIVRKFHSDQVRCLMQGRLTSNNVSSPCSRLYVLISEFSDANHRQIIGETPVLLDTKHQT